MGISRGYSHICNIVGYWKWDIMAYIADDIILGVPEYDDRPYDNSYNSSQAWSLTEVWRFD